jgi:hypothetical protein
MFEFRTAADFWSGMVEPDFADCLRNPADLRAAFHAASSLFHMHDWVWKTHEVAVRESFVFTTNDGPTRVHDNKSFANALEQHCEDFGRIRGIANAAKHLEIRDVRPVANAPSHATQTFVKVIPALGGYGVGAIGYGVSGSYGGGPTVMLTGHEGGPDMAFSHIARTVHDMWATLRANHCW